MNKYRGQSKAQTVRDLILSCHALCSGVVQFPPPPNSHQYFCLLKKKNKKKQYLCCWHWSLLPAFFIVLYFHLQRRNLSTYFCFKKQLESKTLFADPGCPAVQKREALFTIPSEAIKMFVLHLE